MAAALAHVAVGNRYKRPRFSDSGEMRIDAGRHPVIEKLSERDAVRFIPNDLYLHSSNEYMASSPALTWAESLPTCGRLR